MANEQALFVQAERALTAVVGRIDDNQWDEPVPEDFPMAWTDGRPTLRDAVHYLAYDDVWVPHVLAGTEGPAMKDLLSTGFHGHAAAAIAAVEACTDLDRTVQLSYGEFPARVYLVHIAGFRALRAVDIARAIGVDDQLPPSLVHGLWEEIAPFAEEWRALGLYDPAVEVPHDAPLQERLLGLTGRQPRA
jgi:uncharacterized protein (TIGR03086 family)